MNNQKFINYYIDTLTTTLNDSILRTISLQANSRISDEVIAELQQQVQELAGKDELIQQLKSSINDLQYQIDSFQSKKYQLDNIDTFRNELLKAREENQLLRDNYETTISKLNQEIEYWKLPPAKRKRIDDLNNENTETKDGGSF